MVARSTRRVFGFIGPLMFVGLLAFVVSGVMSAQQAPAPAQPRAGAPPQQGQTPAPAGAAGRGARQGGQAAGQAGTDGAVRGPSGAVIGYTNLAEIPGSPWRIHDAARPQPRVVTPGATVGAPPSDAIVLFDGKDLSKWVQGTPEAPTPAKWAVRDGYAETGGMVGTMRTKDNFGDVQLHVEFATPADGAGDSQGRGNSGVIFMGRYEVEVLDSYQNPTYADGYAGAIYGEYPPLVNATRKPGEWQVFDIMFEAPKFNGTTVVQPAYMTVIWNGVLVQHRRPVMGSTSATRTVHAYTPHEAELPISLQDHSNPVRYRNIWVRKLTGYDQP